MPRGLLFYCIKSRKIISKGCIYHLVRVMDVECETQSLKLVLVLNEFPEVFLHDFPGIPT